MATNGNRIGNKRTEIKCQHAQVPHEWPRIALTYWDIQFDLALESQVGKAILDALLNVGMSKVSTIVTGYRFDFHAL
jgi:hypothetical protein